MQIPILKQGTFLIVSIQAIACDHDLVALQDELSLLVAKYRSNGVIIDVTTLDVMDSFSTRMLRSIAHILKLRGAKTIIVGIQPEMAFAMIQLGLKLDDVKTALNLEDGLMLLNKELKVANYG